MARHVACLAAAILTFAIFRPGSALGSSAVVPDDFPTVQGAIDSGVDSVLVREGMYPETPVVDRRLELIGIGKGSRPQLDGLALNNGQGSTYRFGATGIAFAGRVDYTLITGRRNAAFNFSHCTLEGGFHFLATDDPDYIALLTFRNCRMSGDSRARASQVIMEADTVSNGGVSWSSEYRIFVLDCWFQGGPGNAITLASFPSGTVARNVISNYLRGISGGLVDTYVFEGNTISNCDIGIDLWAEDNVDIIDNRITDCRVGVAINPGEYLKVSGNTVLRSADHGVIIGASYYPVVERNVVGYSGRAGIHLDSQAGPIIRRNTVFRCGGNGIEFVDHNFGSITVENNIGYENQGWGFSIPPQFVATLGCNDWFGNGLGAVSGVAEHPTDLDVDPMFCNVDSADVRLSSTSPLVDSPGCGQIGALGVGCGVTATLLQMLTVEPQGSGAVVRWRFSTAGPLQSWLERAVAEAGPWQRMTGKPRIDGEAHAQADEDVHPGATYWYRVGWLETGEVSYSGAVSFAIERRSSTSRVLPNPSFGSVSIEWTLASAADMDVRVYDLAGREVATVAHGRFEPGNHSIRWEGRRSNGNLAPAGWYLVRLRGTDINATHKVFLIR